MHQDETGGIISSWLLQMVIFLAVIALVGYEAITVAVTSINLSDDAREVARSAARAYRDGQRLPAAQNAAEQTAAEREVRLVDVTHEEDYITVAVKKDADTLFIHQFGLFDDLVEADAESSARWRG
ncbi:MAG: hypothetical protein R3320_13200 [Nitriliruptorales bacterium]|nr:hypothetical protein [Nitriliruptorales bacterium]